MAHNTETSVGQGIRCRNLTVEYRSGTKTVVAVHNLNFEVSPGEFVCLLGTSGCGKSTILNVIAGFVRSTAGEVYCGPHVVTEPSPDRGFVFQQHSLFPWKSVMGNVEFGPKMKGLGKAERKTVAERLVKLVGLSGFETLFPRELSGGMQQRVGLARALANDPSVILMDEPFGSLDAQTRTLMQELLVGILEKTRNTVVFVTHDVDEAVFLADRILVLTARPARVKQEVVVPLARPRAYDIVTSDDYTKTKRTVLRLIREETSREMQSRGMPS